MTTDFGPFQLGRTRYNNECILYQSKRYEGCTYKFTAKRKPKNGIGKIFWTCTGCHTLQPRAETSRIVPIIVTENGRLLDNPDEPKHPHFCHPPSTSEVTAEQFRHVLKSKIATTGKTPREAYDDVVKMTALNFTQDPETLAKTIPSFKKLRSTLYRSYANAKIKEEEQEAARSVLSDQTVDQGDAVIAKHSYGTETDINSYLADMVKEQNSCLVDDDVKEENSFLADDIVKEETSSLDDDVAKENSYLADMVKVKEENSCLDDDVEEENSYLADMVTEEDSCLDDDVEKNSYLDDMVKEETSSLDDDVEDENSHLADMTDEALLLECDVNEENLCLDNDVEEKNSC